MLTFFFLEEDGFGREQEGETVRLAKGMFLERTCENGQPVRENSNQDHTVKYTVWQEKQEK